ncbi:MAG TPA: gliding motility protein GldL [Bacteroidetes bacterium]|nr:gliding motility protein GldL [Bacteroidota bacterium]
MGFWDFNKTRTYRNLMAKVYGLGASVVLIGALFKINHYVGADAFLAVGLGTEALIFFLSAFEDPHVEPDWSLVYPELAGMYHPVKGADLQKKRQTPTQQLDEMLKKAHVDEKVIERLGTGLEKLSENAMKMADVTDAAAASKDFADNMKKAGQSAQKLGEIMNEDVAASGSYAQSLQSVNRNAEVLSNAYVQAAEILKGNMDSTEEFVGTVKQASESAKSLAENYQKSALALAKSVEALDFSSVNGEEYNQQIQKIAENLAALNVMYENQLHSSQKSVETSGKMQNTVGELLETLEKSASQTGVFVEQMQLLTQRMESLNKVYGNMLSAMNIQS